MKKLLIAAVASVMIATPVFAKPAATGPKIGVFDMKVVMKESTELKDHQQAMQAEYGPRIEEIQAMEKGLREDFERFQRDKDVMSESERTKLEKEIQANQQEFMQLQQKLQQDTQVKQQQVMKAFADKVNQKIEEFAKEKQFDMVLIQEAVPYVKDDSLDITQEIIKRLG